MTTPRTTADDLLYVFDTRVLDEATERQYGPNFDGNTYALSCPLCDYDPGHTHRSCFAFRNAALVAASKHLATEHGLALEQTLPAASPNVIHAAREAVASA